MSEFHVLPHWLGMEDSEVPFPLPQNWRVQEMVWFALEIRSQMGVILGSIWRLPDIDPAVTAHDSAGR
ncbi:hypothetical protein CVS30_03310 [Arthrobacter psychrolactophilus]|uniref:Uncharacterized protein n=1 Tax=Arthrobacter psychrolactophilus TaxID=92442 RepID=A0A2V5J948_9MICC|nr:hypothetical protein CVS30_03310 [Arthrobacter psychrolactophilus]